MDRRRWGLLILIVGAALLALSLGQYGYMTWTQHRLRQQWQQQQERPTARPIASPASARSRLASYDGGVRLIIPEIHLDDVVVRGTSYDDLLVAPGMLEGTPLPGQSGNVVIAGHRDTFFRHVSDLNVGDRIELFSRGQEYDYRVASQEIVSPDDTSVLANTASPQLTLVTCYPTYWIGPAPKRLIVRAVREP